ncbi:MAG: TIGR00730 family Rossman fold protein [Holophagales bacterium]|nr:TIGR00730 family Rossman fold protein [Holophagales bacterium]MBK9968365.1 TIGR00730 family Rossman fold protein [Holophagales bacterium]
MKSVCVYCGSNEGRLPVYAEAARALGTALVERGLDLVYGGASVGIMGVIADTVLGLGGRVTGVMPESIVRKEVVHRGLTELHVTSSMHERKMKMAEFSDAFVALPGGIGTLEEIFEVWTWAQLGLHAKPCGFLNAAGYYDGLVAFLDHTVAEKFVKEANRSMLIVSGDPAELLDRFEGYRAPAVEKWIRKGET